MSAESDPNGLSPHEPGAKLDAGKPRVGLVMGGFAKALTEVAKVGTFGIGKYSENGWRQVDSGAERYTDAAFRHLLQSSSEALDQESGISHLAHAVWNLLAVIELNEK